MVDQINTDSLECQNNQSTTTGRQNKYRSKEDFYSFLTYQGGYFLPQFKRVNARFLKDLIKGKKQMLKKAKLRTFNVPRFPDLSVKEIMKQVQDDEEIVNYLNCYPEDKRLTESKFYFGVLGTLHPRYVAGLIRHARIRNSWKEERKQEESIEVSQALFQRMAAEPFFSSLESRGHTLHLMKAKSKIRQASKKGACYDLEQAFTTYKRSIEDQEDESMEEEEMKPDAKTSKNSPFEDITE